MLLRKVNIRWEIEHYLFTVIAMALLGAIIVLPGLAGTLNMTRFYHIVLFFLAPLCVVGVEFLVHSVIRQKKELAVSILLLVVLVPYFLFQTNFVYESYSFFIIFPLPMTSQNREVIG